MVRGRLVATALAFALAACRHHHALDTDAATAAADAMPVPPGQAIAPQTRGTGLVVPAPVAAPPDDPTQPVPPPGVMRVLPSAP